MATELTLAGIFTHPLKGARAVPLTQCTPDSFGIPWDRRWMLVGLDGGFLSQRTHPRLALLKVAPMGEGDPSGAFQVEGPGMPP